MAEVKLKIGATIKGIKDALGKAKVELNKFSGFVKKHSAGIRKARLASGAALAGGVLIMRSLIKATAEQEMADANLATAMKNLGTYTDAAFQDLKNFGNEMQNVTTYSNEQVQQAEALLVAVGRLSGEGLKAATKATLDLAAAKKMDLVAAADLVSKSIGSTTNALARYGITMESGVTEPTERASILVEKISAMFGGTAQAQARTYTGQLKQLGEQFADLKKFLGQAILPMLINKLVQYLKTAMPAMQEFVKSNQKLVLVIMGGGIGGVGLIFALSQLALAFTNPVTGVIAVIALAAAVIVGFIAKGKLMQAQLKAMAEGTETYKNEIIKIDIELEELRKSYKKVSESEASWWKKGDALRKYKEKSADLVNRKNKLKELHEAWVAMQYDIMQATPAEQPEITPEMFDPSESKDDIESKLESEAEILEEHLTDINAIKVDAREEDLDNLEQVEEERLRILSDSQEQQAENLAFLLDSMALAWMESFDVVLQGQDKFMNVMGLSVLSGLISITKMMINAAVHEVIAEKIKTTAKLMIMGAIDWSAIAKIAMVSAAAGAAKGALGSLASKAEADMRKSAPRHQYGGVLPEAGLYYGEKGEVHFNPAHARESLRNTSGAGINFTWVQQGNIDNRKQLRRELQAWEDKIFRQRLNRSSV